MKRKLTYFLSLFFIWVLLSGCQQTHKEHSSEERDFYIDTVYYEDADEVGEIYRMETQSSLIRQPRRAEIAIKDESLHIQITIDTFKTDSLKQQTEEKQDSLRIIELKTKKTEGDKLRPKEEKELAIYEHQIRQENVVQQLNQLEEQHAKIDSLLKNK